ncbi:Thiol reductase thioredoxin [Oopsacas minuta]|uniref:Thioredoxin n=1 Tax=Oopsacas minuta TaxID=111878 RepID=A0AAV7JYG5_9METZ|nr:Thiol reductase thioredoxin [Oopsacas minuta]
MPSSTFEISSMEELDLLLTSTNSPLVMYFYADWCTPCELMSPSIEEFTEDFDDMKFVKVNVELRKDIKSRYGIEIVPACVILNQGEELYTFYGARKDALQDVLSQIQLNYCYE